MFYCMCIPISDEERVKDLKIGCARKKVLLNAGRMFDFRQDGLFTSEHQMADPETAEGSQIDRKER